MTDLLEDNHIFVRHTAILSLGQLQSEQKIPALIKFLRDTNETIRITTVKTLSEISPNSLYVMSELSNVLKTDESLEVRKSVIERFCTMGTKTIPELFLVIQDRNEELRYYAIEALGNLGLEAQIAIPILTEIIEKDKNIYIKKIAMEAIEKIKNGKRK